MQQSKILNSEILICFNSPIIKQLTSYTTYHISFWFRDLIEQVFAMFGSTRWRVINVLLEAKEQCTESTFKRFLSVRSLAYLP
jgi:hypothetical protein